jgi:hypothetical protein
MPGVIPEFIKSPRLSESYFYPELVEVTHFPTTIQQLICIYHTYSVAFISFRNSFSKVTHFYAGTFKDAFYTFLPLNSTGAYEFILIVVLWLGRRFLKIGRKVLSNKDTTISEITKRIFYSIRIQI